MFILLDTGYSSSFENDALIKNTSKRKNKSLNTGASEHITSWEVRDPHLMGFFTSLNYVMETLILHFDYQMPLNYQYAHIHTKP